MSAAKLWKEIERGEVNPDKLTLDELRDLVQYLVSTWRDAKRKKSYVQIPSVMIEVIPYIGTGPFALWCILRRACPGKDMTCYYSLGNLARALGKTGIREVLRYRRVLERVGLLEVVERGNSRQKANVYALLILPDTQSLANEGVRPINGRLRKAREKLSTMLAHPPRQVTSPCITCQDPNCAECPPAP